MDLSYQQLLLFNALSTFFHDVGVQCLLYKFPFHDLVSHYNVGIPLVRLYIHSDNVPKNDLMLCVIVHAFGVYLGNSHPKQFHYMICCKTQY